MPLDQISVVINTLDFPPRNSVMIKSRSCEKSDFSSSRPKIDTYLLLVLSMQGRDCKVGLAHLLGEPVDLPAGVAKDDGLGDGETEG
jgi:hypothetical protein